MKCKRCDEVVPNDRVAALPETALCVDCSHKVGGEFKVIGVPTTDGGLEVVKIRRDIRGL